MGREAGDRKAKMNQAERPENECLSHGPLLNYLVTAQAQAPRAK